MRDKRAFFANRNGGPTKDVHLMVDSLIKKFHTKNEEVKGHRVLSSDTLSGLKPGAVLLLIRTEIEKLDMQDIISLERAGGS